MTPLPRTFPSFPMLLLVACGAGQTPIEATSAPPEPVGESASASTEPSEIAPTTEPEPADPTLEIRLHGELDESRSVTPVVEIYGGTARLAKTIGVEREVDGHFEPVTAIASLELRADCQTPAPECVELVAGAELRPPPWLGMLGDAQCVCTRCGPAPAGSYRFVLSSCDGRQRVESATFHLSAP